jgi:hypothetical protein
VLLCSYVLRQQNAPKRGPTYKELPADIIEVYETVLYDSNALQFLLALGAEQVGLQPGSFAATGACPAVVRLVGQGIRWDGSSSSPRPNLHTPDTQEQLPSLLHL